MDHQYVVGFLFDDSANAVLLIEKQGPEWQKGKLNGIGGKIENHESPREAMVREFEEETGVKVTQWQHFASLGDSQNNRFRVYFYFAFSNKERYVLHHYARWDDEGYTDDDGKPLLVLNDYKAPTGKEGEFPVTIIDA